MGCVAGTSRHLLLHLLLPHLPCYALHRCHSAPMLYSDDLFRVMTLSPRSYEHSIDRGYSHPEALRVASLRVSSARDPRCSSESEVLPRWRAWAIWSAYT